MSPVDDGTQRVFRDADGFLRDERGLKSMAHLAVFYAMNIALLVAVAGVMAVFSGRPEGTTLVTSAVGLAAAGAGLEGWTTHTEGRNQRAGGVSSPGGTG